MANLTYVNVDTGTPVLVESADGLVHAALLKTVESDVVVPVSLGFSMAVVLTAVPIIILPPVIIIVT